MTTALLALIFEFVAKASSYPMAVPVDYRGLCEGSDGTEEILALAADDDPEQEQPLCTLKADYRRGIWSFHYGIAPSLEIRESLDEQELTETGRSRLLDYVLTNTAISDIEIGEIEAVPIAAQTSDSPGQEYIVGVLAILHREIEGHPIEEHKISMFLYVDGTIGDVVGVWPAVADYTTDGGHEPFSGCTCHNPASWVAESFPEKLVVQSGIRMAVQEQLDGVGNAYFECFALIEHTRPLGEVHVQEQRCDYVP